MCVKIMAFIKTAVDSHALESFNDTQAEGNVGGRRKAQHHRYTGSISGRAAPETKEQRRTDSPMYNNDN